jgi:hypothetical protein
VISVREVEMMGFSPKRMILLCLGFALFMSCVPSGGMENDFLPALIAGNIRGTDLTVILEITEGERVSTLGGYALWRISAVVIRSFKGGYAPGETLEYHRTTETEFPPPEKDSRHIVSFVLEEGRPVIPDEGYHFPWSPELEEQVTAELARSS